MITNLKIIFIIILFILFPTKADAYLDPGTGSMILQALIGIIATIFTTFYIFWTKICSFFKKIRSKIFKKK